MAIVNSYTKEGDPISATEKLVTHYFEDQFGKIYQRGPLQVPITETETEYAIARASIQVEIENALAKAEADNAVAQAENGVNPDKVPAYQPQSDYDRRVLGRAMTIVDAHHFFVIYSMFQAVESRGGANANQRASYLGISTTEYNQIASRFSNVSGVSWFLTDEKNQIWNELPDIFN